MKPSAGCPSGAVSTEMPTIDTIGYLAAGCEAFAFAPQPIFIIQGRNVQALHQWAAIECRHFLQCFAGTRVSRSLC